MKRLYWRTIWRHLKVSKREFYQRKRIQMRELDSKLGRVMRGSAALPNAAYKAVDSIQEGSKEFWKAMKGQR